MSEDVPVRPMGAQSHPPIDAALNAFWTVGGTALVVLGPDGAIAAVNPAFEALAGYASDEVTGRFASDILHGPDSDQTLHVRMIETLLGGEPFRYEFLFQHKSGRPIWLHLDMTPVIDSQGQMAQAFVACTDITHLKIVEQQLQARDAAFRSASKISRLGGWSADRARWTVTYSPEAQDLFGLNVGELSFEDALAVYPSEYQEAVNSAFVRAFEENEAVSYVAELVVGNGRTWVQVIAETEVVDGRVVALNGVIQDITRLQQAQAQIEVKDRYAAGVMEAINARVGILDAQGEIILANRVWRDRLLDLGEQLGVAFTWNFREQCAHIKDRYGRDIEQGLNAILDGSRSAFSCVFQSQLTDPPQWFLLEAAALDDAGEARIVVIQHNITALKQIEAELQDTNVGLERARQEAEAANNAKSQFLANLSHEIRTPLNGVVAIADMLSRARLGDAERDMVETIRTSADTLSNLLADMLDLVRIESGRIELEISTFNLADAVRSVVALSDMTAHEKGVRLSVDLSPDSGVWVVSDQTRLKQILTNLVGNAVKFTAKGEVSVKVSSLGADRFAFEVVDTGIGFDPADRERLFNRFEQADASVVRQYGGSGLGLAIVRELVELLGGTLESDSVPGVGSRFRVELPLAVRAAPQLADREQAARPDASAGLSVLAADDHPVNRRVMELILGAVGCVLTTARDGAEALDLFSAAGARFDLVLMDMQMPVMDGLSATRAIRQLEIQRGQPRTPVVMVSANAMSVHVTASLEAGADLHLAKPLTADSLIAAINSVLTEGAEAADTPQALAGHRA